MLQLPVKWKDRLSRLKRITDTVMAVQSVVMFWTTAAIMLYTVIQLLSSGKTVKDITDSYTKQVIPTELTDIHYKEECRISKKDNPNCIKEEIPCTK